MNIPGLIGKKSEQKQAFLENGKRIPLTILTVSGNVVCQIKTADHDGYNAVQLGFSTTKKTNRAKQGHITKAGLTQMPRFFREIRVDESVEATPGSLISVLDVLKAGDIVNITGISKGKGFAGVVKRHHFRGGPRTHGQSDRERAPGSIGQTTTPGRVYRGKRMAGHMGVDTVTVQNLEIIDVIDDMIFVKGLVPGPRGSILTIIKVGENKKFIPLFKKGEAVIEEVAQEILAEAAAPQAETPEIQTESSELSQESESTEEVAKAKIDKAVEKTEEKEIKEEETK